VSLFFFTCLCRQSPIDHFPDHPRQLHLHRYDMSLVQTCHPCTEIGTVAIGYRKYVLSTIASFHLALDITYPRHLLFEKRSTPDTRTFVLVSSISPSSSGWIDNNRKKTSTTVVRNLPVPGAGKRSTPTRSNARGSGRPLFKGYRTEGIIHLPEGGVSSLTLSPSTVERDEGVGHHLPRADGEVLSLDIVPPMFY
jgi:hypothetical protein